MRPFGAMAFQFERQSAKRESKCKELVKMTSS
jgi:hypothetical protein